MKDKLRYIFAKDEKNLRQYYRLRKIIYNMELGIDLNEGSDEYDPISEVMVVKNKEQCVGGARITIHYPNSNTKLPMESDDFRLKDILSDLNLDNYAYAEFSRLILMPKYRDNKISQRIYKSLNRKARQLGVRYIFVITDKIHARRYILSYRKLGFKIKILDNVIIPNEIKDKYSNIVQCILMLDIEKNGDVNNNNDDADNVIQFVA